MAKNIRLPINGSRNNKIHQMLRVDHAGEYGAVRIYKGQMASLKKHTELKGTLEHMLEQEEEHLKYFDDKLKEKRIRPSALMPFWHIAGYGLGFVTGLIGKKAAMACTVAIEEEIDEHYESQINNLSDDGEEGLIKEKIKKFQEEELEHRDIGIKNEALSATGYKIIYETVRQGCKIAIKLAKKY